MIAADTNVLVRIVANDDSHQTSLALKLLCEESKTTERWRRSDWGRRK